MGKHSRRKPSYLPKVAAGAAPLALLLAGPTAALATQTDQGIPLVSVPLPLDHQREGAVDRGIDVTSEGDNSVLRGFANSTERNVYSKDLGDAKIVADVRRSMSESVENRDGVVVRPDKVGALTASKTAETITQGQRDTVKLDHYGAVVAGNETKLQRTGARLTEAALDPRTGRASVVTADGRGFGASEGTYHAARPLPGFGVINETEQHAGGGLDRTLRLDGGFAGDLGGALETGRSSGHAVDLGEYAAVGTTSAQHGGGRFSGVLDTSGAGLGQEHALGGSAGPVAGLVTTSQDTNAAQRGAGLTGSGANKISGDLGVVEVAHVRGATTTSARGILPTTDPTQAGNVRQSGTLDLTLLGQQPTHTGVTFGALPLELKQS